MFSVGGPGNHSLVGHEAAASRASADVERDREAGCAEAEGPSAEGAQKGVGSTAFSLPKAVEKLLEVEVLQDFGGRNLSSLSWATGLDIFGRTDRSYLALATLT